MTKLKAVPSHWSRNGGLLDRLKNRFSANDKMSEETIYPWARLFVSTKNTVIRIIRLQDGNRFAVAPMVREEG